MQDCASTGCSSPNRYGLHLELHGVVDFPATHAHGGVFHAEGTIDLIAEEAGEGCVGDAANDFAGEQNAHALILHFRAGSEEQRRGAGGGDEVLEGRVALAEIVVLGEHVGEPGGMGEQVADEDLILLAALEFRDVFVDGILDGELPRSERSMTADAVIGLEMEASRNTAFGLFAAPNARLRTSLPLLTWSDGA